MFAAAVLLSNDSGRWSDFKPRHAEREEKVGELTECEHCTAEYQTEGSANVTHQRQQRVPLLRLNVRVLQLREEYLHRLTMAYSGCVVEQLAQLF